MLSIPIIAVVGGIGSGKSTVAAEFAQLGCAVFDADRVAHQLLLERQVQQELVNCFGAGIRNIRGRIDRKKLAEAAFANPASVGKINAIFHPRVMEECHRRVKQYQQDPAYRAIVLDVPLILEAGGGGRYDRLVFVDCPWEIRLARAAGKGLTAEEIKKRENFQISLDKKRAMAHYIVQNDTDRPAVTEQVRRILAAMNDNR